MADNDGTVSSASGCGEVTRPHRAIHAKRHDDSLRAEKSLLEKQRKEILRGQKKNKHMKNKSKKSNEEKKIKKLSTNARLAALTQASQIVTWKKDLPASTPNSSVVGTPVLSPVHKPTSANGIEDSDVVKSHSDNETGERGDDEEGGDNEGDVNAGEFEGEKDENSKDENSKEEETDDDTDSDDSDSSDSESDAPGGPGKKRKTLKKEEYLTHLRYSKDDKDVVELHPGSEIYVNEDALDALKAKRRLTHTGLVRVLIEFVFTDEAAVKCSVLGGQQKGPKGKTEEARPALYPTGVQAIEGFALAYSKSRKLKLEDPAYLHKQMNTKLSEIRSRVKEQEKYLAMREQKKQERLERKMKKELKKAEKRKEKEAKKQK